jgi:glycerol-3-phosphate dehydrogenase
MCANPRGLGAMTLTGSGARRERMGAMQTVPEYDVLVVGGGINGTAIARDAAGRGLRVLLCEQHDLGQHTSSSSSKLIHGGLRYLEQHHYGLVRKALIEREILLKSAPHIMRPLRFVLPHDAGQRPAWLIRCGLFLYDHLARRDFLPGSHAIDLRGHGLQSGFRRGFAYSDGWVDDARLVVLNALDARERGGTILTRTRCTAVTRHEGHWHVTLATKDGARRVTARALVNAAGPWAGSFGAVVDPRGAARLRLIKGSHIVVPRLFDHDDAWLFQHPDGRVVFAMPYEGAFTLIGTTDVDYTGDAGDVSVDASEVAYLCNLVNRYVVRQITPADVVWRFAGVRPIVDDGAGHASSATRDFRLVQDMAGAPLLTVLGGKITTCRKLAEQAVDWLAPLLGATKPAWTARAYLPGGDLFGGAPSRRGILEWTGWEAAQQARYSWLPAALVARYARAYGTRMHVLLAGRATLGEEVLAGLFEAEIDYLAAYEWARSGADILWRRSKLGLHLPPDAEARLDAWLLAKSAPVGVVAQHGVVA